MCEVEVVALASLWDRDATLTTPLTALPVYTVKCGVELLAVIRTCVSSRLSDLGSGELPQGVVTAAALCDGDLFTSVFTAVPGALLALAFRGAVNAFAVAFRNSFAFPVGKTSVTTAAYGLAADLFQDEDRCNTVPSDLHSATATAPRDHVSDQLAAIVMTSDLGTGELSSSASSKALRFNDVGFSVGHTILPRWPVDRAVDWPAALASAVKRVVDTTDWILSPASDQHRARTVTDARVRALQGAANMPEYTYDVDELTVERQFVHFLNDLHACPDADHGAGADGGVSVSSGGVSDIGADAVADRVISICESTVDSDADCRSTRTAVVEQAGRCTDSESRSLFQHWVLRNTLCQLPAESPG